MPEPSIVQAALQPVLDQRNELVEKFDAEINELQVKLFNAKEKKRREIAEVDKVLRSAGMLEPRYATPKKSPRDYPSGERKYVSAERKQEIEEAIDKTPADAEFVPRHVFEIWRNASGKTLGDSALSSVKYVIDDAVADGRARKTGRRVPSDREKAGGATGNHAANHYKKTPNWEVVTDA